jgi:hypothetical protein
MRLLFPRINYSSIPARFLLLWLAAYLMLPLNAFAMGNVSSIELDAPKIVCDSDFRVPCGVSEFQNLTFLLHGVGTCTALKVSFGDGESKDITNVDFDALGGVYPVSYLYSGSPQPGPDGAHNPSDWGGPKTVIASGIQDCSGEARMPVRVLLENPKGGGHYSSVFKLAMGTEVKWTEPCKKLPGVKKLPANTLIKITSPADDHDRKINFGCWFGGCIYDADGSKGSKARDNFPFPGYRDYSLILRAGSLVVQGGTDVRFTTTNQSSDLEFCINDNNQSDNSGAWFVKIEVDESQAVSKPREPVACRVGDYGRYSQDSEAIYVNAANQACVPDAADGGFCAERVLSCHTPNNLDNVMFKVFNDAYTNIYKPISNDGEFKFTGPGRVCSDGGLFNSCRRWFGKASTTDGRPVQCYLFNDGMSNLIGPTDAIYFRQAGQVCMPDGSSDGACRKWFGNCEVVN